MYKSVSNLYFSLKYLFKTQFKFSYFKFSHLAISSFLEALSEVDDWIMCEGCHDSKMCDLKNVH